MLDRYWQGATTRISPEAPVPVVRVETLNERPGGAANVALNLAALGVRCILLGLVGQDDAGQALTTALRSAGVDARLQALPGLPTITKLRVISRHQQLLRLDFEQPFPADAALSLLAGYRAALAECDLVILSDYAKGALHEAATLIAWARTAGKPVLVDPKNANFGVYRGASLITPNLGEFETAAGRSADTSDLTRRAQALCQQHALDGLLVTRGEGGMSLVTADGTTLHWPAEAREVYDVTGAGDTVIAVLGASLAAATPLAEAVRLANTAAGLVVGKLGAASITPAELLAALHLQSSAGFGVLSETALLAEVARARARGERLVMTNGCFDLLHVGHVRYLSAARRLGDRLIVAVNDDASVQALKGSTRPLNPLDARLELLAALACVDWVVAFSEPTPQRLICAVLPDVLVKGGDYAVAAIVGGDCVLAHGGQVLTLDYHLGYSTSQLIQRIHQP
jgi:D-beta-D-heptose 7-phosphate kinase/D-beta-D-heptose 1-phosphate adenosyltransferase